MSEVKEYPVLKNETVEAVYQNFARLKASEEMCDLCFASIKESFVDPVSDYLHKKEYITKPEDVFPIPDEWKTKEIYEDKLENMKFIYKKVPLFVTIKRNKKLRGCFGTFNPNGLVADLWKFAKLSAFEDKRFAPIEDMMGLNIEVNTLHTFEKISDIYNWEIGKHGIKLYVQLNTKKFMATFLPSVAVDNNYTKTQTLVALLKKIFRNKSKFIAGSITEKNFDLIVKKLKPIVIRYESSKFNKDYSVIGVVSFKKDGETKKVKTLNVKRVFHSINETLKLLMWETGDKDKVHFEISDKNKMKPIQFKNYFLVCDGVVHADLWKGGSKDYISFEVSVRLKEGEEEGEEMLNKGGGEKEEK